MQGLGYTSEDSTCSSAIRSEGLHEWKAPEHCKALQRNKISEEHDTRLNNLTRCRTRESQIAEVRQDKVLRPCTNSSPAMLTMNKMWSVFTFPCLVWTVEPEGKGAGQWLSSTIMTQRENPSQLGSGSVDGIAREFCKQSEIFGLGVVKQGTLPSAIDNKPTFNYGQQVALNALWAWVTCPVGRRSATHNLVNLINKHNPACKWCTIM